jgi:mRNA-degrading endonuclease RelE of RelBE toxin-antitoxin system
MSFSVEFSTQASKFIKSLSQEIINRIKKRFKEISENPFRYLEHFEGEKCYKIRIGDYRGLIDVNFDRKILFVRVFDKRGRIYKKK